MAFPQNVYILAAASGFVTTAASLPAWRALCRRWNWVDDPGHRKIHREPIPLAGGLAVLTGLIVPLALAMLVIFSRHLDPDTLSALNYGFGKRRWQLAGLLGGAIAIGALGWLDDRFELPPSLKLAGQILITAGVAATGTRITLFVPNPIFSYLITVLWLVTLVNALNFQDNMNGLCAGVGAIGSCCFALKAALAGQYLVAALAFLGCGALAGFLPYNYPRATVFLGDAGSHVVGYLLGALAVLPHFYTVDHPVRLAVLNPILIVAVPLADLFCVVLIRWRLGQPFYVGDNNHFSHRLVRKGLSQPQAVLVLWLAAATTGALAFL
jgi:UDP-GlcNAc:undecaprenyl-phosphate GlcNAc-1-phosphate transferase